MSEEQGLSGFELYKSEARADYVDIPQTLNYLAAQMREWQDKKAELEEQLKLVNAHLDVLRFEAIPGKMDEDGIEKITLDGIGQIVLRGELFLSVKNKEGLNDWLHQHKLGSIIQSTINASTLKAFVKGRIKEGKEYGAEYMNVTPVTQAVIINKPKGQANEI